MGERSPSSAWPLALLAASGCTAPEAQPRPEVELARRLGPVASLATPDAQPLPPGVDPSDGTSCGELVAIALWNDPGFLAVLAEMGLARADLAQARRLENPSLSFLFAVGEKQAESTLTAPLTSWLSRGARERAARRELFAIADRVVERGARLAAAVERECAELVYARAIAAARRALEESARRAADLESERERLGDASAEEALGARARALDAQLERDRAERDVVEATARLRARLGAAAALVALDDLEAADPIAPDQLPGEHALALALDARPDVTAAEVEVEAARERCTVARRSRLPVSVLVDANSDGEKGWEVGPGLSLELPLFDDGSARVARAEALLRLAERRREQAAAVAREELELALAELRAAAEAARRERSERLPALERRRAAARVGLARGALSPLDLERVQLARMEAELAALEADRRWRRASAAVTAALCGDPRRLGEGKP